MYDGFKKPDITQLAFIKQFDNNGHKIQDNKNALKLYHCCNFFKLRLYTRQRRAKNYQ